MRPSLVPDLLSSFPHTFNSYTAFQVHCPKSTAHAWNYSMRAKSKFTVFLLKLFSRALIDPAHCAVLGWPLWTTDLKCSVHHTHAEKQKEGLGNSLHFPECRCYHAYHKSIQHWLGWKSNHTPCLFNCGYTCKSWLTDIPKWQDWSYCPDPPLCVPCNWGEGGEGGEGLGTRDYMKPATLPQPHCREAKALSNIDSNTSHTVFIKQQRSSHNFSIAKVITQFFNSKYTRSS